MSREQTKAAWRALWTVIRSALAATALLADFSGNRIMQIVGADNLTGLLVGAGFFALFTWMDRKQPERRGTHWTSVACAALFSAFMVVGKAFALDESFDPITRSLGAVGSALAVFVGCFLFFLRLLDFGYARAAAPDEPPRGKPLLARLFPDNAPVWRVALIILICWLPYLIVNFPGGCSGDMWDQLGQFFGHETRTATSSVPLDSPLYLNTMNPVPHTVLLGLACSLFRKGGEISLGVFAFCITQTLAFAFTYARTVRLVGRLGLPRGFRFAALAFYCLNPLIPLYAFSVAKDSVFALLLLLTAVQIGELYLDPDRLRSPARPIALGATILLFILFRASARYIAFAAAPAAYLAIAGRIGKKRPGPKAALAAALVLPILLSAAVTDLLYPAIGIRKGTEREEKSFIFQQTARYVVEYPDEVTPEERAAIAAVLDYDTFDEYYDPGLSDYIKGYFNDAATEAQMDAYYRTWRAQFMKHPMEYVEAAISMGYAYYYPDMRLTDYRMGFYVGYTSSGGYDGETWVSTHPAALDQLTVLEAKGVRLLASLPVAGAAFSIALYSWALIAALAFCLRARARIGLLLVPFIVLMLGLGLTPVNGSIRYALGLITAFPLTAAIAAHGVRPKVGI